MAHPAEIHPIAVRAVPGPVAVSDGTPVRAVGKMSLLLFRQTRRDGVSENNVSPVLKLRLWGDSVSVSPALKLRLWGVSVSVSPALKLRLWGDSVSAAASAVRPSL